MEIALISTEALRTPPPKYGGIEAMAYDLAKGLVEKGVDVCLFAVEGSKSPSGRLVEILPEGWGKVDQCEEFVRRMVDMKKYLASFDVVHDNSHSKPCWKIHERVVNTVHWWQNPYYCGFKNVVAISGMLAKRLQYYNRPSEIFKEGEIKVVHNGCDISKYTFNRDKSERFLFLSALGRYKGADVAFDLAKNMTLPMDFAGIGGIGEEIKKESTANPNIRFYGEVTEEEKVALYRDARALIFPTGVHGDWDEPFGLVAIEAMACGTPVITWNNGAMPEVVEHGKTGFVCNSIKELEEAVNRVDEIRPEDCRRRVEENFSYQAMADKYLKLYEQLMKGKPW